MRDVEFLNVFTFDGRGGNPCPTITNADDMNEGEMLALAKQFGYESAFIFQPPDADHDFLFRYFVPRHEMEMCGHATIGALWALARQGRLKSRAVRVKTKSGTVLGFADIQNSQADVAITQPAGTVSHHPRETIKPILTALGIDFDALADLPVSNAATSRVKTLVPIKDTERLNALSPIPAKIEAVCNAIGSTGLYPFAVINADEQLFEARQFPKSSGYLEDAATGIAATALAFGLLESELVARDDRIIRVFQGRAMGKLSAIDVRLAFTEDRPTGCLMGGKVSRSSVPPGNE